MVQLMLNPSFFIGFRVGEDGEGNLAERVLDLPDIADIQSTVQIQVWEKRGSLQDQQKRSRTDFMKIFP